jgi:hypothetical protein
MEEPRKLPPIRYAKLRGLYPQKVYAAIRGGFLPEVFCDCGRKSIEVEVADKYFKVGGEEGGKEDSVQDSR